VRGRKKKGRDVMAIIATLTCWHCGTQKEVTLPHAPQFAFELAGWANDAGMYGVMDLRYSRALVFCNKDHAENEKTKAGHFRVRAKGPTKQPEAPHGR
jgi:hypothetical protein